MDSNLLIVPVYGFPEYQITSVGEVLSKRFKRPLRTKKDVSGYPFVQLSTQKGVIAKRVHRLMAESFLLRIPGKTIVNHKDGSRDNNKLENLEWCTHQENICHTYHVLKTAKPAKGESAAKAKLNWKKVRAIRSLWKKGQSAIALGKKFGVGRGTIYAIVWERTWKC